MHFINHPFFAGFRPVSVSRAGQVFEFNPNTFATEYQDYFHSPLKQGSEFNIKKVYNAAGKRNLWQKLLGEWPIRFYQACTRFNKIPVVGDFMRTWISDGCVFKQSLGTLSCSELGMITIDQLGQNGLWGVLKAWMVINKRTRTCGMTAFNDQLCKQVENKTFKEPVYQYTLKA